MSLPNKRYLLQFLTQIFSEEFDATVITPDGTTTVNRPYLGVFSDSSFASWSGIGAKIGQISDGTSNTFMMGEISFVNCHSRPGPCYNAWSASPAVMGTNYSATPNIPTPSANWNSNFGFSTPQAGIIHMSFCDGSARSLRLFGRFTSPTASAPPEYYTWIRMGGMMDGESYDVQLD